MASLVQEYIKTRDELKKIHGDRLILMIHVGSFFEVYSEDVNDDSETSAPNVAKVLGIRLTRKDGKMPISKQNPMMLGVPSIALDKYLKILIDNRFTVGIIEQVSNGSTKIQRKLMRVVSKATYESSDGDDDTRSDPKVMTVYSKDDFYGISVISLMNGLGMITETNSEDELMRMVRVNTPVEIVIMGTTNKTIEDLKMWCTWNGVQIKCELGRDLRRTYENIEYQNEIMRKVFPNTGLVEAVDYIDENLHRLQCGLTSYCRLLQFAYDHDEKLLTNIPVPTVDIDNKSHGYSTVKMNQSALNHLNVLGGTESTKTMMKLLNGCKTSMGKRMFYERMTNPITDTKELELRLDVTERNKENWTESEETIKELNKIYDLSRLARKAGQMTMNRKDIIKLIESMDTVARLEAKEKIPVTNGTIEVMKLLEPFDIEELANDGSPYKPDYRPEIESVQKEIGEIMKNMNGILEKFNATEHGEIFKMEKNEKDGVYLVTTQRRWNEYIKTEISEVSHFIKTSQVTIKSPGVRINIKEMEALDSKRAKTEDKLRELVNKELQMFYQAMSQYEPVLHKVSKEIADLDVAITNAKNAKEFRLSRPSFTEGPSSKVQVTGLRHLIVEEMNATVRYISNDVDLNDERHGILLFGLNAAGKSTLMKSVGVAVIMAQAGMYVPCDSMEITPYSSLYTRIGLTDDIYRNYSTFVMEMMELRNIIEKADSSTLVLGDELCSSTEYVSALSIVGAALQRLHSNGTSFIFASHLHDLTKLSVIKKLEKMKIMHMAVRYDTQLKTLIYERKLEEGAGSDTYGIEVLKSVMKDKTFLREAETIRKEVTNTATSIVEPKRSRYNAKLFKDSECGMCGSTETRTEVHHINHQKSADSEGYIKTFHKNDLHNLVNICETCHDKIHRNEMSIDGYVVTLEGKKLKYKN